MVSVGLILLTLILIYSFTSVNNWVNDAVATLTGTGLDGVIEFIRGYKGLAAIVSSALMILASVLAPNSSVHHYII